MLGVFREAGFWELMATGAILVQFVTLAGYLVDRLGIAAPFLAQAFLCTAGATTLWRVVSEDGRAAPPDRDR